MDLLGSTGDNSIKEIPKPGSKPSFIDQLMGNIDYTQMYSNLKDTHLANNAARAAKAVGVATGAADAGAREAKSNITLSGHRNNTAGNISSALSGRANARATDLSSNLSAGINQNAADTATQITNTMDQAGLDANISQTQSTQQMLGNIIGGGAKIAGMLAGMAV